MAKALRLADAGGNPRYIPAVEFYHRHRVIFEFCYEQPAALEIDRQMIDAAANFTERDFALEHKKRAFLGRCGRNDKRACDHAGYCKEFHGMTSGTLGLMLVKAVLLPRE
jgi:hypothetical protein